MQIPIRKITKAEMVWLVENNCISHNHSYASHYTCFIREKPDTAPMTEKIGIFDIETVGLKANWSHMLCWCMLDRDSGKISHDLITRREVRDKVDKRIIKSAIKEIAKYDRIVTYYGRRFDIPYTRSRALYQGVEFPGYRDLYHTDLYFMAREKFAIHSNRLGAICQYFGIEAKSHPMTPELWQRAGAGNEEALKTILTHCEEDVDSTNKVFDLLLQHIITTKRSI